MGPWSKLERRLRDLPDPALDLRLRFTAYRRDVIETPHWSEVAGRFWITLGKRTIWAVPNDRRTDGCVEAIVFFGRRSAGWLVEIAAEYLDLPRARRFDWQRDWNGWGLVDILKACDRTIGRRRWDALRRTLREPAASTLLDLREGRLATWPRRLPGGRGGMTLHDPD